MAHLPLVCIEKLHRFCDTTMPLYAGLHRRGPTLSERGFFFVRYIMISIMRGNRRNYLFFEKNLLATNGLYWARIFVLYSCLYRDQSFAIDV